MRELSLPFIRPNIPPENQQEAILTAVLNIQAHIMSMANILMTLETLALKPEKKPADKTDPIVDSYRAAFYGYARTMQKLYRDFGELETF
jgi:hypothetical protein